MSTGDYRSRFIDGLGFGPDHFQLNAIEAIDQNAVSYTHLTLPTKRIV